MTFSSNMQDVATKLLTKYGENYVIQISRVDEGAFVPSTGAVGAGSTTSIPGVGFPYPYNIKEIDGRSILSTDIKLIIKASAEIKVGDTITIRGVNYRIMNVSDISAQGQNIIYEAQLRA